MKAFPMFLKTSGRRIVILGEGSAAAAKARLALKTDAEVIVAAERPGPELIALEGVGLALHRGPVERALLQGSLFAFIATGCRAADAALAAQARDCGVLVNVVDAPDLCDATTPALVDRDPVVVAIGTEGTAPVLARQIKTRIEALLEPSLGELAALAGRLRGSARRGVTAERRRGFWSWVFSGAPRSAHALGSALEARRMIEAAIAMGGSTDEAERRNLVSLVGAGPGSRDLITLRGVQRLQEADVILYDRLVDPELLELARRDAERIYVGKAPGSTDWPQERINARLVEEAQRGRRVVRLKCGDPGIFARGAEEAAALDAAGIAWEIVPGVTAASAAAAAGGSFLTERGQTDAVVMTTGQLRKDGGIPDWAGHLRPGTTLAVYMGVRTAPDIQAQLLAAGIEPELAVDLVSHAGMPSERFVRTTLGGLAATVRREKVANPAMILLRRPSQPARQQQPDLLTTAA